MKNTEDRKASYEQIISLPHHRSLEHPPMSMYNRAAQFASFNALKGGDDDEDDMSDE